MYVSALLVLAILRCLDFSEAGISYQTGKLNMSQTFQHWSCSRACSLPPSCRLPRCTNVQFPRSFGGSSNIRVYVSMSHGEKFIQVHSPSSVWIQSINTSGFEICAREAGINKNESGIVNWLAFQDQLQLSHGSVALSGIWTTETKCNKVTFTQSFVSRPYVFISAKYTRNTKPEDAMYVWLENLSSRGFEVCLREFLAFDGKHQDTIVDWFAFVGNGSEFNFTRAGETFFPNNGTPGANENYGFCKQVQFKTTFYVPPVVLISVHHQYNGPFIHHILPENNIITAWVEQAAPDAIADLKKELVLLRQKHDAGTVDSALGVLRQLLARPAAIFDPHASMAALEQLVDLAREKGDERANRFGIVLRQTRTLLYNPSFQHLFLKLIGSKEEVEVAKEIQKALKQSPPTYLPGNSVNSGGPSRPFPRARQAQVCFLVVDVAITPDLVGLSVAHTPVSTVNESLFVVNKEICGLHVVSMTSKSCTALTRLDPTSRSGVYVIDPDGNGGLAPFEVTCNMTDKNGVGVTIISHGSESRTHVQGCESAGCYSRDINYTGASLSQLAILKSISSHCEQFIKYECYGSRIFRDKSVGG
ncbi:uncharacterized protein [Montipora capricornis]|uniref:uncharacterized protein n=1 Tax=Montipora capricornis TaxID=246305 RepID=UPI0035F1E675